MLKLYYGRGPLNWCREQLFAFRVKREYHALRFLENKGIPCSRPQFWTYGNCPELGGRWETLATVMVPNAVPLHHWLATAKRPELLNCLQAVFRRIRDMHEAGMHHGALYTRNILLDNSNLSPYLIDLPRAEIFPGSIIGSRPAWIDLLNFCHQLRPLLAEDELGDLLKSYYGLSHQNSTLFLKRLTNYRPNKHSRNQQRALVGWRRLISRIGALPPREAP